MSATVRLTLEQVHALALQTLGYAEKDALTKVAKALETDPNAATDQLVKAVLRQG